MRERKEIEEQVEKRTGGSSLSCGISQWELQKVEVELLLDIRDLLTKAKG